MIGAIAGDMIGAPYEGLPVKTRHFDLEVSRFTDDSVLTVAVAHAILQGTGYRESIQTFAQRYPHAGYGGTFQRWMWLPDPEPYNSFGNGAAMRVSPVGFAFDSVQAVLDEAKRSAEISHNHPEGIKGAQATALAVFLARKEVAREVIRREIAGRFGYDLDRTLDEIRPAYGFDVSSRGRSPSPSSHSWNPAPGRTPSETPSPLGAMQIPWPASQAASPRHTTGRSRRPLSWASAKSFRRTCLKSQNGSTTGSAANFNDYHRIGL